VERGKRLNSLMEGKEKEGGGKGGFKVGWPQIWGQLRCDELPPTPFAPPLLELGVHQRRQRHQKPPVHPRR